MKTTIFILAFVIAAFSSCTTAYKTGQTPDDVYYSAAKPQSDEVKKEKESEYTYDDEYYDDRYLRMKVRNRYQWNDLNDWYYYDRYSYGYNNYYGSYYYGSYYNPYSSWNYYYNPYSHGLNNYYYGHSNNYYGYSPVAVTKPIVKPHNFSLGGYTNTIYNNANNNNLKTNSRNINTRPVYNNSNNNNRGDGLSKTIQTIFSGNSNNNGSSGRTYNPSSSSSSGSSSSSNSSSSSSSSSSGSSGSSGGGGVSRPVRN